MAQEIQTNKMVKLLARYSADWMQAGFSIIDYLLVHKSYYKMCNVHGELQLQIAEYFRRFPDERSLTNTDKFKRPYADLALEVKELIHGVEDFYLQLVKDLRFSYPTVNSANHRLQLITDLNLCDFYKVALEDNPIENHNRIINLIANTKESLNMSITKFLDLWKDLEAEYNNKVAGGYEVNTTYEALNNNV